MKRFARLLTRLYPAEWRERYGEELTALVEDMPPHWANGCDLLKEAVSMQLRSLKFPRAALLLSTVGLLVGMSFLVAQPAFEVASVKPNISGDQSAHYRFSPGFHAENATVKNLIITAYDIPDFRITGGPGWISSDRFDIEAKVEGDANPDQKRLMLRTLLHDRFRLTVHRGMKQLPIYALTVAKGGFKLQPLKPGACITPDSQNPALPPGKKLTDYCGLVVSVKKGQLDLASASMGILAESLSRLAGRTVIDKTGIAGVFPVHLTFAPDETLPDVPGAVPDGAPSFFTAVQGQLGLKLESGKGAVEVLAIDHVEKPSGN